MRIQLPKSSWTFPAVLRAQAEKYGNRTFCSFQDGTSLSFQELETKSNALASALARLGVGHGDRVVALLYNSRAFVIALFATHKRGAIFVPINTELKGSFLQHQLKITEPKVVFVDAELRRTFDTVELAGIPVAATITAGADCAPLPGTIGHRFEILVDSTIRLEDIVAVTPYDAATIIFTSGTTGPSKGVLMPHAHCFYNGWIAKHSTRLTDADTMYIAMPLFHGTALLLQFYASLQAGAPAHIVKRFSATSWLSDVRSSGATVTYAAGVMPEFILNQTPADDDRDNPLRLVWSVPVSDKWGPEFENRFDVRLLQAYGMTELCVPVWGDVADPLKAGCAGRVVKEYFDIRVVDPDTDEPLKSNEIGEIVGRPLEPFVFMAGYFRMPDKTAEAWRNLWFHTGDAGYFDDEGRLFYVDRIKDRIRRRGENISAFEVEEVLNAHPDVLQCAVVGVKVASAGGEDEVLAYVVTGAKSLSPKTLLDWCVPRMPRYAVPRYVEFVSEIPQTATGKVRKQAIRDVGVTDRTWDRDAAGYILPR